MINHKNCDGDRDQLILVGQKVLQVGQYREGTVFEMEEDVSKEFFEMGEEKHESKQYSINRIY